MLKIWGRTNSINVQKVMWVVAELGLEHERIDAGGQFGGLDTAEYGAMNPNRKVPTLQDGDLTLWESNTIVRYLGARHGRGSLWPEDTGARARVERWMDWQLATIGPDMTTVFWGLIRTPEEKRDHAAIAAAIERLGPSWRIVDEALARQPYLDSSSLTVGDVPVGAMTHRYLNLPIERPALPNLDAYYKRLAERPAYRSHVMLPVT